MPIFVIAGVVLLVGLYFYGSQASAAVTESTDLSQGGADASLQGFTEQDASGNSIVYPNTRGYRNHNPGNLIYIAGDPYDGQIGADGAGYGVYRDMPSGVRAAGKQADNFYNRGLNTVTLIITAWAPPASNPTAKYIAFVAQLCAVGANDPLSWETVKPDFMAGIFTFENGACPIPQGDLVDWLNS